MFISCGQSHIHMSLINARIDDKLLKDFRHVVYLKYGLKKGDLTKALEEAIKDYVQKNAEANQ